MKISFIFYVLWYCIAGHMGHAAMEQDAVRQDVQNGKLKPLSEILQNVQKRHPGKVFDVELERQPDGQRWYEIKLLNPEGERIAMYVNALTGAEVSKPARHTTAMVPMAVAVRAALAHTPGTVLKVELEKASSPQALFEVDILQADGRKRTVQVDAHSAQLLEAPGQARQVPTDLLPLPALLDALEPRYAGRITEIELKRDHSGTTYYEIELQLDNGRELEINVDGTTGKVIREDGWR